MMTWLFDVMKERQELVLFLVLGLGYLIGKFKFKGFEIGSTAGVLFAGLFIGSFNFEIPRLIQTVGFILFIYSVGFQAGPQFFQVIRKDGAKYMVLAVVIAVAGFASVMVMNYIFDFEQGISAGIMAGAMTSTPTLAAAQDAIASGNVEIFQGMTTAEVEQNISTSYAITYVFGMVGLIAFIQFMPKIFRINLPEEAKKMERAMNLASSDIEFDPASITYVGKDLRAVRLDRLPNEKAKRTIGEIEKDLDYKIIIQRVRRGKQVIDPTPDFILQRDDLIIVSGKRDLLLEAIKQVGTEELDPELKNISMSIIDIVLTKKTVSGRKLGEVLVEYGYGCFTNKMYRAGIEIIATDNTLLQPGDILRVIGEKSNVDAFADKVGYVERAAEETDLLTFCLGIVMGLLIGVVSIKIGNIPVGLGTAGGLLLTGLIIGYLRSRNPTFGRVPRPVRWVFMEFGLTLFMASVGVNAGSGIIDALKEVGLSIFIAGALVTVVPVFVGYLFGRIVMKLNPAVLLGALTGSMTSTPALSIVNQQAKSSLPALGYTGAYAFANVLLTIAGNLIVRF